MTGPADVSIVKGEKANTDLSSSRTPSTMRPCMLKSGFSGRVLSVLTRNKFAVNGLELSTAGPSVFGACIARPPPVATVPPPDPAPDPEPVPKPPPDPGPVPDPEPAPTTTYPGRGANRASNPIVLAPQVAVASGFAESSGTRSPGCSVSCTDPPGEVAGAFAARTRCQSILTTASTAVRVYTFPDTRQASVARSGPGRLHQQISQPATYLNKSLSSVVA